MSEIAIVLQIIGMWVFTYFVMLVYLVAIVAALTIPFFIMYRIWRYVCKKT